MIDEAVAAIWGDPGIAHANVVRREAAPQGQQMGDDIAPEVGWGGVAVQKNDWIALAGVDIGDVGIKQRDCWLRSK
jgi:hypothetical protein